MTAIVVLHAMLSAFVWEAPAFGAASLPEGGTYRAWAWVPPRSRGEASFGGQALSWNTRDAARSETDYRWVDLGTVTLAQGALSIEVPDTVLSVALGAEAGFDPAASQADRRIDRRGAAPGDGRMTRERHTDTVFTMPAFSDREAWEAQAATLRKRILVGSGLYPEPARTPLNARIFDRIQYEDHSVEKVVFEAWPGFLVTGNLYRPVGEGPFPGVIGPHGHWEHGRLEASEKASVPTRGATLARMGMVAFNFDMVGYQDSHPFTHSWGGPEHHIWGLHPFGLQLWSAVRALDFLETLPEVDPERLACTGASGGGTQTFIASAVDPRIKVAAPVNMISSTMQGGCICENAPLLRLDNSNMEIAALMAPRPLLLISATGDWTRETPRVEYPAIASIYRLYGAGERVENVHIDAGHNYNRESREAMYRFFGRYLLPETDWSGFEEPAHEVEAPETLRVFPDGPPEDGPDGEAVLAWMREEIAARWQGVLPTTDGERAAFRDNLGQALALVLHGERVTANGLEAERVGRHVREDHVLEQWYLGRKGQGERIPAHFYYRDAAIPQDGVLVVHGEGKAKLADLARGGPGALVRRLLDGGAAVLAIDAYGTGEHVALGATDRVPPRRFPDTFLPTDTAWRVQDVLTGLGFLRSRRDLSSTIHAMGLEDGGLWSLLAAAVDGGVAKVVADFGGLDYNDDATWSQRFYVPAIRAVGGLDTALALLRPSDTLAPGQHVDRPKLTVVRGEAHFGGNAPQWIAMAEEGTAWEALAGELFRRVAFYPVQSVDGGQP